MTELIETFHRQKDDEYGDHAKTGGRQPLS
jgi:hypothetical protein